MSDAISRSAEQYLIDGEELFNRVQKLKHYEIRRNLFDEIGIYEVFKCQDVLDAILASERLDAVPVVHASWRWANGHYECTACGGNRFHDLALGCDASYCPRCGAKMDGEAE